MLIDAIAATDAPTPSSGSPTANTLFDAVWRSLSDVIGTAAAASIVRRSVRAAAERGANLEGVAFRRHGFKHAYVLPASWAERGGAGLDALRLLMVELSAILRALTGPVLVHRLAANAELERAQLFTRSAAL